MGRAKTIRRGSQANAAADLRKIAARARKLADETAPKVTMKQIWEASFSAAKDENDGYIRTGQTARRLGVIDKERADVIVLAGLWGILSDRVISDKALKQISQGAKARKIAFEIFPSDDQELVKLEAAVEAAAKAHGLKDDEDWPAGEEPEEVKKFRAAYTEHVKSSFARLLTAWDRRLKRIITDVCQEQGEGNLAGAVLAEVANMPHGIRGQVK